jgi:hypothetical protein
MSADIILIGPPGAGKSTVGKLLAAKLAWPQHSMDKLRWEYYREIGYDADVQKRLRDQQGFGAVVAYWKPFETHAVERLMSEHHDCAPGCVIDFGAGHSHYEDQSQFDRVQQALALFPNVVLLLPSADLDESIQMLADRTKDVAPPGFDHTTFVKHPSNHRLARHTVYTTGETPEQTRDRIIAVLGL